MTKEQKEESKYLTRILNCLSGDIDDKTLITMSESFTTFTRRLNLDKLGLLRKGEVMLGEYLYKIEYTDLKNIQDFLLKLCSDDSIAIPVLIVMLGAAIEYTILKRKEIKDND